MLKVLRSDDRGFAYEAENQSASGEFYYDSPCFDLDRAKEKHAILGFGASMTDASCYLIHKLPAEKRTALLKDLFAPDKLALSIIRLNVGASDYATKAYNYDDVPEDTDLKHFSIAHDEKWIIPCVQEALKVDPGLFLFSSPWSPPGWMKTTNSMCGGYMREKYLPVFADYLVKYLQEYRKRGIAIQALTMQNEADAEQLGTMPQSLLHPDFEMELLGHLLPPRLATAGLDTQLWLYDHNYSGFLRVLYMLSDPEVRKHTGAVAFHPYKGKPEMMRVVREQYPDLPFQLTEKGPNLRKDSPESTILWWHQTISRALNNGCSSFVGWNYALDENGTPELGPFDCAGLVEIHSRTQEITPSAQYHAFRHYAPFIRRGARVLEVPQNFPAANEIDVLFVRNPDGSLIVVAGNTGEFRKPGNIQLKYQGKFLKVQLPKRSLTTLVLKN